MSTKFNLIEKIKNNKTKIKLIAILAVEFIAVIIILALVLFAGKKSYTVTFDLNGGVLLGGEVEQRVVQGQNATPPSVAKYGHYLLRWSGSYKSVTRDVTVKAIWEYETSPGIEYYVPENTNYCEIAGSYRDIQGDVYIGAYYEGRQVMGIKEGAFKDRVGVRGVYLLDGILGIADEAFSGCTSLEVIELPSTVVRIGREAFKDCTSLKEIILPKSLKFIDESAFEGCTSLEKVTFYEYEEEIENEDGETTKEIKGHLETIGENAFAGCEALIEVIIPTSVKSIGKGAFDTEDLVIKLYFTEEEIPEGFDPEWCSESVVVIYDHLNYVEPTPDEEEGEESEDKEKDKDEEEDDDKSFWEEIIS
ncbi:MAG: leucine-rich repeat protein [Clostridia bacterium]|nr:leucine-rich repeat protein [Clostridia bacterium]